MSSIIGLVTIDTTDDSDHDDAVREITKAAWQCAVRNARCALRRKKKQKINSVAVDTGLVPVHMNKTPERAARIQAKIDDGLLECGICYGKIVSGTYRMREGKPCLHGSCYACGTEWLEKSFKMSIDKVVTGEIDRPSSTCHICRREVIAWRPADIDTLTVG